MVHYVRYPYSHCPGLTKMDVLSIWLFRLCQIQPFGLCQIHLPGLSQITRPTLKIDNNEEEDKAQGESTHP